MIELSHDQQRLALILPSALRALYRLRALVPKRTAVLLGHVVYSNRTPLKCGTAAKYLS